MNREKEREREREREREEKEILKEIFILLNTNKKIRLTGAYKAILYVNRIFIYF